MKLHFIGKAPQENFFTSRHRAFNELHHADFHPMPHGAHHHAETAGTFAFAVAAIDHQDASLTLRRLDLLIH